MDDKHNNVEMTSEPKLESRFGYGKDNKVLSKNAIKYGSITCGVCLVAVFLLKSPEVPLSSSEIKTPEVSQINQANPNIELDSYSVTEESRQISENKKKSNYKQIVKFPGLQKIDRHQAGKIPPGSLVKAILATGASNGPVRAEITKALRLLGETLLPVGTVLLGTGQSSEERLFIRFNQVVFKNGSFENIQAQAADLEDKTVGLKGSRLGKYATKYAAAIGLNFVGGMAEGLQEREVVGQQVVAKPTTKNALLNGASRATLEMANESMTDLKNSAPIIHVEAGKEIYVIFEAGN